MDKLNRVLHLTRSVTNFHSTITIDQLINVPLLAGRFKVKWKFNNPLITHPTTQQPLIGSHHNARQKDPSSSPTSSSGSSSEHNPTQTLAPNSQLVQLPIKSEPTGSTDYIPLRNHAVLFRHAFHCPISIELDKNGNPQPSILTIIVKQEHINELGRRIVSRHGLVHIDLTQYTPIIKTLNSPQKTPFGHDTTPQSMQNFSRIEKSKFLLKECKTNAHLKIQIQMDYIGGLAPFNISPKNLPPVLTPSINGPHSESQHLRVLSQQDDARSIFNTRKANTYSSGSSIISDGSSQHPCHTRTRKQSSGTKSAKTNFSEPTDLSKNQRHGNPATSKNQLVAPQPMSSQLAQNVIDLIFSPHYPSSSPHPSLNFSSSTTSNSVNNHPLIDRQANKATKRFANVVHSFL